MSRLTWILIVAIFCPCFSPLKGKTWQETPWVGLETMYINTEKEFSDILENGIGLAITANFPVSESWILELEGRHFTRDGTVPGTQYPIEARSYRYHVGGKYLWSQWRSLHPFFAAGATYTDSRGVSSFTAAEQNERIEGIYLRTGFEMAPTEQTVFQAMIDLDDSVDAIAMLGYRLNDRSLVFVRGEIDVENEFGYVSAGIALRF